MKKKLGVVGPNASPDNTRIKAKQKVDGSNVESAKLHVVWE